MDWNSDSYNTHAHFVSQLGGALVQLLQPQRGEAILDLGCGDGTLALDIARQGAAVRGIDSSADMVRAAQEKGINAMVMDGHDMTFRAEFDAVFSNAALHWMKDDPDRVLSNVHRALRAGGRFCAEFGGAGNVATIAAALRHALGVRGLDYENYNPWYFPEAEEYKKKLQAAGFTVSLMETFPRPTPLPTDMVGWLSVFAQPFLKDIPPPERQAFLHSVARQMENTLKKEDGNWIADYVRCRFLAVKK